MPGPEGIDTLRGLTVYESVPDESPEPRRVDVELCPGAHVYHLTLCATLNDPDLLATWNPDVPLAILRMQDSELRVYVGCCQESADYPGLRWPASAKLTINPGVRVKLALHYGHCT